MYLDKGTEFASKVSVGTPNSTTVNVGDVMNTEVVRDIGAGQPIYLVVQVTTAITSGGSATVRFKLASDAVNPCLVDGTQTEHWTSNSIAVALLVAGYRLVVPLPAGSPAYEQFLNFQVEEDAGQALTAGNVDAFLTNDAAVYQAYADAVN